MNIRRVLLLSVGIVLVLLGGLWFLQGAGIVVMNPILCFANCEPIVGPSTPWIVTGIVALLLGIGLVVLAARRSRSA